ncbi:MAG: FAD-dependent oxidoreductase [Bdellovibrio sp.]
MKRNVVSRAKFLRSLLIWSLLIAFRSGEIAAEPIIRSKDLALYLDRVSVQSARIETYHIQALEALASPQTDSDGRVTPELQAELSRIESRYHNRMSEEARQKFLELLSQMGARSIFPIQMPKNRSPFFLLQPSRLAHFQSKETLPQQVDYLVLGAGLTGASVSYFLSQEISTRKQSILTLDKQGVGEGASGRNGGLFGPNSESFFGDSYTHILDVRQSYLRKLHPGMSEKEIAKRAWKEARALAHFGRRNAEIMENLIQREGIEADFVKKGWLRIATSEAEEKGLFHDIDLARSLGVRAEYWPASKIHRETPHKFSRAGRFYPDFGNYHPYKFTVQVFERALASGLQLFTHTEVFFIEKPPHSEDPLIVHTSRGVVKARRVIVALDGYTSKLLPDLAMVEPTQSQVVNYEHLENKLKGLTITEFNGDLYFQFPKETQYIDAKGIPRGMLHLGGGLDQPLEDADEFEPKEEIFEQVKMELEKRWPEARSQVPSRAWAGAFGTTPDRMPVLGGFPLKGKVDPRLSGFAGSGGYGGFLCVFAGYLLARWNLEPGPGTQRLWNRYAPQEFFGYERFLHPKYRGPALKFPIQGELFPQLRNPNMHQNSFVSRTTSCREFNTARP